MSRPARHWALMMAAAVAVVLALLVLAGCKGRSGHSESVRVEVVPATTAEGAQDPVSVTLDQDGTARVAAPAGSGVTISRGRGEQPVPPKGEASSWANAEGAGAGSGDAGKIPIGIGGMSFWVGLVLIIAGLALMLAKRAGLAASLMAGPTSLLLRAAAVAPRGMGLGLMGLGAAVIVLPWFLDQLDGWFVPLLAIGVAALFVARHVWNLRRMPPPVTPPKSENDIETERWGDGSGTA